MSFGENLSVRGLSMRLRVAYVCLIPLVTLFLSVLPSQPVSATAQVGFMSTSSVTGSYATSHYEFAFTFLTNSTVDELTSVSLIAVGSSSMTLSLYTSDVLGQRGTFITNIATVPISTQQIYDFIPTTPILLQPNSYYWIEIDFPVGSFAVGSLPTSDYYTLGISWLYVISSSTFHNSTVAPLPTLRIDTLDTLSASVSCVADDIVVTIPDGDGDFEIRDGSTVLMSNASTGTTTLFGPITTTNLIITELRGDGESLNLGGITCPTGVVTPPTIPSVSAVTVLGCALDTSDGVEIANAPDNTYCRVLMKNGGVVSYSGAIPADLIALGVILAVDVYRLEGGKSITSFPDYARICLAGEGRLFYLDARTSPRSQTELATESVDGLTCGWIPATGTLILTQ